MRTSSIPKRPKCRRWYPDPEGESADRRTPLGRLRAAHPERHHRWRHRPGLLSRNLRPLQPELGRWHQQQPGILLRNQGPHHRRLRLQHGFDSGIPGQRPATTARNSAKPPAAWSTPSPSPAPTPFTAISSTTCAIPPERARPAPEVARHLHAADPPATAVRRQRRRTDHQGQAVLLLHLRRFAQGQSDQLHQHHLSGRSPAWPPIPAATCAAANAFIAAQLGAFPRFTDQDVGFGKLDYQFNSEQPRQRVVRSAELQGAELLPHGHHADQQFAPTPTAPPSRTSGSSSRTGIPPSAQP